MKHDHFEDEYIEVAVDTVKYDTFFIAIQYQIVAVKIQYSPQ